MRVTKEGMELVGIVLRFITPLLIGLLLMMASDVKQELKGLKVEMNNHLVHDVADMKADLAVIKNKLDIR